MGEIKVKISETDEKLSYSVFETKEVPGVEEGTTVTTLVPKHENHSKEWYAEQAADYRLRADALLREAQEMDFIVEEIEELEPEEDPEE